MEAAKRADLKDKLDIAHAIMEADHQQCNRLVQQMIELSSRPNMRFEIFGDLIRELKQYALSHYDREESFMELSGYPDVAEHMREHARQMEEISQVSVAVANRDQSTVHQLLLTMVATWLKHRDDHDRKLSEFINMPER